MRKLESREIGEIGNWELGEFEKLEIEEIGIGISHAEQSTGDATRFSKGSRDL